MGIGLADRSCVPPGLRPRGPAGAAAQHQATRCEADRRCLWSLATSLSCCASHSPCRPDMVPCSSHHGAASQRAAHAAQLVPTAGRCSWRAAARCRGARPPAAAGGGAEPGPAEDAEDEAPPQLMGDWRAFRAKMVAEEGEPVLVGGPPGCELYAGRSSRALPPSGVATSSADPPPALCRRGRLGGAGGPPEPGAAGDTGALLRCCPAAPAAQE